MKHNVGRIDAVIRWFLAAIFFGISLAYNQSPAIALLAAAAAVVMVATALTRTCPIYWVLGIDTCPRNPAAPRQAGG